MRGVMGRAGHEDNAAVLLVHCRNQEEISQVVHGEGSFDAIRCELEPRRVLRAGIEEAGADRWDAPRCNAREDAGGESAHGREAAEVEGFDGLGVW